MAQLRVRKKPATRPGSSLVPMALVLAAGLVTTFVVGNGTKRPAELVAEVRPVAAESLAAVREQAAETIEGARLTALRRRSFEVEGRAWVIADHPPVESFPASEMRFVTTVDGHRLLANSRRGLAALGTAAPFDRLYLELASGRYAPMRWRDVPQ